MTSLKCPYCPSIRFLQVVKIVIAEKGGQVPQPDGLVCQQCQAEVNPGEAYAQQQLAERRKALEAEQAELNETAAMAPRRGPGRPRKSDYASEESSSA